MPTLDWIGKKAVVNRHREVPYQLLRCALIPMKVVTDSDLIPVSDSDAMRVAIGAKRRGHPWVAH